MIMAASAAYRCWLLMQLQLPPPLQPTHLLPMLLLLLRNVVVVAAPAASGDGLLLSPADAAASASAAATTDSCLGLLTATSGDCSLLLLPVVVAGCYWLWLTAPDCVRLATHVATADF